MCHVSQIPARPRLVHIFVLQYDLRPILDRSGKGPETALEMTWAESRSWCKLRNHYRRAYGPNGEQPGRLIVFLPFRLYSHNKV